MQERSQARQQRHILERAHIDEPQAESGFRDKPNLHATRGADKQHVGPMVLHQFMSNCQSGDNMSAGSTTDDENAQIRQMSAFQEAAKNSE